MKKELTTNELWAELVSRGLFTNRELQLLTSINGFSIETLNRALYIRYGYRDYDHMLMYE
jgi:hypothetical protein